jgi:hypothetical protein
MITSFPLRRISLGTRNWIRGNAYSTIGTCRPALKAARAVTENCLAIVTVEVDVLWTGFLAFVTCYPLGVPEAFRRIDLRLKGSGKMSDEGQQSTDRAQGYAPSLQDDEFDRQYRWKNQEVPGDLVVLDGMPDGYERCEGQSDRADEAEHRESYDHRRDDDAPKDP